MNQSTHSSVESSALALAALHALQACTAHQPPNRAVRHRDAFTQQLFPDLARAVNSIALVVNPFDFNKSRFTLTHLRATPPKMVLQLHAAISGRWCDGQFLAHRLDP